MKDKAQKRYYAYLATLYAREEDGSLTRPRAYERIPTFTGFALYMRMTSAELLKACENDEELRSVCQKILDLQEEERLQRSAQLKSATGVQQMQEKELRERLMATRGSDDEREVSPAITVEVVHYSDKADPSQKS